MSELMGCEFDSRIVFLPYLQPKLRRRRRVLLSGLANYLSGRGHEVKIHRVPIRKGVAKVKLSESVEVCQKPLYGISADVCYFVYMPLVTKLLSRSPKIRRASWEGRQFTQSTV